MRRLARLGHLAHQRLDQRSQLRNVRGLARQLRRLRGALTLEALEAVLRQLNPKAAIVRAERGIVPLDQVLDTGRFDLTAASQAPGWLAVMRGEEVPESEELRHPQLRLPRATADASGTLLGPHPRRLAGRVPFEGVLLAGHQTRCRGRVVAGGRRLQLSAGRTLVGRHSAGRMAHRHRGARGHRPALARRHRRPPAGDRHHRPRDGRDRARRAARCVPADRRRDGARPRGLAGVPGSVPGVACGIRHRGSAGRRRAG